MMLNDRLFRLSACLALTLAAACGDSEAPPAEDHTPVSYTVLVNGAETSAPFNFTAGQTALVRLKFVNAAGEDLDAVKAEHFAGLTFNPTSLATVTRVTDEHYQFNVTGGTAGATGTLKVSFGHDEQADETTFTAEAVEIKAPL